MSARTRGHREVETKFDVEESFVVPPLSGVDGIASAAGPVEERLDALYFDTEDLRLARNRITLRRREGGHDAGWHLKLPADGAGRDEISRPLDAAERNEGDSPIPDEFVDVVAAITRRRPLRPVARLRTVRQATTLRDQEGRDIAELAEDTVHAQTFGATTISLRWRELEVELLGDNHDVLPATTAVLLGAGAQPASGPSKLVRALGTRAAEAELPAHDSAARGTTAGQAIQDYLSTHTAALLAADARVRLDEPESVHDLRVAARRLRSTLRTFGPLFDSPTPAWLEARLRELNLLLNDARDGEVQLDRFGQATRALDQADVLGPVDARVQGHLRSLGLRGRERALVWLRGEEYAHFVEELVAFVREPAFSALGRRPARGTLRKPVRSTDRTLRRRVRRALTEPPGPQRDAALHAARKAAKRLRYAGEAVAPALGPDAARHAGRAKKIQNLLGEHQDCVVAQDTLRAFAIAANLAGESSFTYGLLLGGERERARDTQDSFAARWPKLSRKRDRRYLS
ncbi:Metal-binding protein [Frankia sp. AiPs1]|uniref:CYTH and CHAD domain-containing protein n=1 Tax=Frankia sp. AiPa1 TaxID=573492 RepID=UPI00202B4CC6|nr:CYTH and CHAD domain-containing protein [Frankia sp. AiPa1]MCL9762729.1 CYTH and CHAD domain-containing protein [Frankia sp. AiPa1]